MKLRILIFVVLAILGISSCKPTEKLDTKIVPSISFKYNLNDKEYSFANKETIEVTTVENLGEKRELVTPFIYASLLGGVDDANYSLKIIKLDNVGIENGGISTVCAGGQCLYIEDLADNYNVENISIQGDDNGIQLHYDIAEALKNTARDYRLKLSIFRGPKELGYFVVNFKYNPNSISQKEELQESDKSQSDAKDVEAEENTQQGDNNDSSKDNSENQESSDNSAEDNKRKEDRDDKLKGEDNKSEENASDEGDGSKVDNSEKEIENKVVKRRLVVMDFTDQACYYCGINLKNMEIKEHELGDKIIPVSIHVGWRNYDDNLIYSDWRKYEKIHISGTPTLVANNSFKTAVESLSYLVNDDAYVQAKLDIVRNSDKDISLNYIANKVNNAELNGRELNILFWLVEDGLIGYQYAIGSDYIHNNVLRGPLGDSYFGEQYNLNTNFAKTYKLPSKIKNIKNCKIIAILVDANTHEFLDAVVAHM